MVAMLDMRGFPNPRQISPWRISLVSLVEGGYILRKWGQEEVRVLQ